MSNPTEEKRYIIHLSPKDYVALTGIHLANVRDELADCGDETNREKLNKAIRIIDNNLVVKEVSEIEDLNHYQNNTIVAYDRSQLDDALGKKTTDADWVVCQNAIHDNDYAWSAMSDACANAEDKVAERESEVSNA